MPPSIVVDVGLNRPVLNAPGADRRPGVQPDLGHARTNGYAEKFKHSIEPFLTIDRTIVGRQLQPDRASSTASTSYVGGTQLHYGINNRFYAQARC